MILPGLLQPCHHNLSAREHLATLRLSDCSTVKLDWMDRMDWMDWLDWMDWMA